MSDGSDSAAETEVGPVVIGIAFGNATSSIAFTTPDGKAEVIANEEGDRQIPTVLSYLDGDEFHGTQAKAQLVRNPTNTVAYFRDFLGKPYSSIDPTNCHHSAHPVDVDGAPSFNVIESGETPTPVSVSEMTTRHLARLRDSASDFLGKRVTGAVITVPTDFTETQRSALTAAAKATDLEILQIIHEPVAAALAYASKDSLQPADKLILVADLGGTRSDVAVVAVRGGMYTIVSTAHDYELGGVQLDQGLVDHFAKEFEKKHKSDPRTNPRALAKLKLESESVKRTLSIATSAPIAADSLMDGLDFHSTINRLRFEMLSKKVFDQIVKLAEHAVQKADLDLLDIDEVILSGGTAHIPKVATRIAQLFPETTKIHAPATDPSALNPSELSARGAAIQASLVSEYDQEEVSAAEDDMMTITPHLAAPIGVVLADGQFAVMLPAQTAVPARRTAEFLAPPSGGDVLVKFCEGEREIVKTIVPREPDSEDDEDNEDEEDEEEVVRSKVMKVKTVLAEARLPSVEKGRKIEVTVMATAEGGVSVAARIVGTQVGVRGVIKAA